MTWHDPVDLSNPNVTKPIDKKKSDDEIEKKKDEIDKKKTYWLNFLFCSSLKLNNVRVFSIWSNQFCQFKSNSAIIRKKI